MEMIVFETLLKQVVVLEIEGAVAKIDSNLKQNYRVFHRFGQAKFAYGGWIFGSRQFTLLPHLLSMMMFHRDILLEATS